MAEPIIGWTWKSRFRAVTVIFPSVCWKHDIHRNAGRQASHRPEAWPSVGLLLGRDKVWTPSQQEILRAAFALIRKINVWASIGFAKNYKMPSDTNIMPPHAWLIILRSHKVLGKDASCMEAYLLKHVLHYSSQYLNPPWATWSLKMLCSPRRFYYTTMRLRGRDIKKWGGNQTADDRAKRSEEVTTSCQEYFDI